MSNLSDLLPAGASAKQITATDSGSGISSKAPVILNSDGTVTEVSGTSASIGSATDPMAANAGSYNRIQGVQRQLIYDTTADRIILAANCNQSGANQQVRVVAGQVSGSTCTFGSSINIDSTETGTGINVPSVTCAICFDEDNGFPLVFVRSADSSYFTYPVLVPLVVSGSTISLGTPLVIESAASSANSFFCTYDTTNDKVLCVYGLSASTNLMRAAVVTVSSTSSLSVTGSPVSEPNSTAINQNWTLTYAPDADLHFFAGTLYSNKFIGTTIDISTGSAVWKTTLVELVTSVPTGGYYSLSTYDSTSQAIIATYYRTVSLSPEYTNDIVPVVLSGSGASTGMSVGTIGNTGTAVAVNYYGAPVYDPDKNVTGVTFNTSTGVSYVTATLTGVSPYVVSTTPATVMDSSSVNIGAYNVGVYDPDTDQICNIAGQNGNQGCIMYSPGSTNISAQSFVGVADSAISASAAGSIIVQGGTVAGLTSASSTMSFGSPVNFDGAGWKQKNRMAYDTTNNRVVNIYEDNTGTGYVTAVVGTVSGTTTEWGTAVVVKSAATNGVSIAYDANAQKMVAYYNSGSAHYARVGTVSGSGTGATISFGTEVTVVAANADLCAIAYDANAQKVVVTVEESSVLKALVGTVAGTDITFGTAASFYSGDANNPGPQIAYDANAQKVVIQYTKTSDSYGYAIVGTIGGTDITFGTEASYSAATNRNNDISYDSTAQKLFLSFRDSSNNSTGIVGTIAGTDITFGAVATAITGGTQADYSRCVYDPDNNITIVVGLVNSVATVAAATISGTSVSFSSPQTFNAFSTSEFGLTYDTTADKAVVVYAYFSGAGISPAVVITTATPFVTGSSYYVQTDGTFSTSADTPSVKAGLAISTTSLLLNGDS